MSLKPLFVYSSEKKGINPLHYLYYSDENRSFSTFLPIYTDSLHPFHPNPPLYSLSSDTQTTIALFFRTSSLHSLDRKFPEADPKHKVEPLHLHPKPPITYPTIHTHPYPNRPQSNSASSCTLFQSQSVSQSVTPKRI